MDKFIDYLTKSIIDINNQYIKFLNFKNELVNRNIYSHVDSIDFINNQVKLRESIRTDLKEYDEKEINKLRKIIECENYLRSNMI